MKFSLDDFVTLAVIGHQSKSAEVNLLDVLMILFLARFYTITLSERFLPGVENINQCREAT